MKEIESNIINSNFQDNYSQARNAFGILALICLTRRFFIIWILSIFKMLPFIGEYYLLFYYFIIFILIVLSVPYIRKKFRSTDIIFTLIFIMIYIISYLNSESSEYLTKGLSLCLLHSFPLFFVGICFSADDEVKIGFWKNNIYDWFYYISVIGIIVNVSYYLYCIRAGREIFEESSASTNTLIPLCYTIYIAFIKKSPLSVIISLIGFFSMIAYGVRTNIIIPIAMLLIMLLLELKSSKLKVFVILLICLLSTVLLYDFDNIILGLESIYSRFGISSRFFYVFHLEGIGYLSNREIVWAKAIEHIKDNPIGGYGLFGDRSIYGDMNGYSHNLFLELFIDLGVFIGIVAILLLIVTLIKGFLSSKKENYSRGFLLSIICAEFIMLLASGSYLVEAPFFFMIGYALCCSRQKEYNRFNYINENV